MGGSGISTSPDVSRFLLRVMAEAQSTVTPIEFVSVVNRVHHDVVAKTYEGSHLKILIQGEAVWKRILTVAERSLSRSDQLEVLDFGCGTGFVAELVIRHFGPTRVRRVVLVDSSSEMLKSAGERIQAFQGEIEQITDIRKLDDGGFDLVCENSVLHHLAEPTVVIGEMVRVAKGGGVVAMAQEPSRKFERGVGCAIRTILSVLRRRVRTQDSVDEVANVEVSRVCATLMEMGVIQRPIPTPDVQLIVDFWVPRPGHDGRQHEILGFDVDEIVQQFAGKLYLRKAFTYQHLGKPAPQFGRFLRAVNLLLALLMPQMGQQLALVLQKPLLHISDGALGERRRSGAAQ